VSKHALSPRSLAAKALPPPECQPNRTAPVQADPSSNPIYQALRDYQAGKRSALPRSAAEAPPSPPAQACSPACVWGTCQKVGCGVS
jgi:hypothetical protein